MLLLHHVDNIKFTNLKKSYNCVGQFATIFAYTKAPSCRQSTIRKYEKNPQFYGKILHHFGHYYSSTMSIISNSENMRKTQHCVGKYSNIFINNIVTPHADNSEYGNLQNSQNYVRIYSCIYIKHIVTPHADNIKFKNLRKSHNFVGTFFNNICYY